jgi:hypothetical protein
MERSARPSWNEPMAALTSTTPRITPASARSSRAMAMAAAAKRR